LEPAIVSGATSPALLVGVHNAAHPARRRPDWRAQKYLPATTVGAPTRILMMGSCLTLVIAAWTIVRLYSVLAAVVMSVVAMVIPPIAVMVANAGDVS
jgi:hypothetical protein